MTNELKKCPFCGREAKASLFMGNYGVYCTKCMGAIFPNVKMTKEEAIEAWNTRKPMDEIVEQLERAKGKFKGGTLQEHYYCMGINEAIEIVKGGIE